MELKNEKELKKRNGAILTAKQYSQYSTLSHSAITKRLRKDQPLPGIGNISRLGKIYALTVNVK